METAATGISRVLNVLVLYNSAHCRNCVRARPLPCKKQGLHKTDHLSCKPGVGNFVMHAYIYIHTYIHYVSARANNSKKITNFVDVFLLH